MYDLLQRKAIALQTGLQIHPCPTRFSLAVAFHLMNYYSAVLGECICMNHGMNEHLHGVSRQF